MRNLKQIRKYNSVCYTKLMCMLHVCFNFEYPTLKRLSDPFTVCNLNRAIYHTRSSEPTCHMLSIPHYNYKQHKSLGSFRAHLKTYLWTKSFPP